MRTRREFIKNAIGGLAATSVLSSFTWSANRHKLCILHTNDMHSRIEPFPTNHPKYPGLGGMARRAKAISMVRRKEEHVLLLDSGDIFQGTPYFNMYGGELEFKLMSQMRYDAATMGNHDFDNGLKGFKNQLPHAKFPFICSNYDFSNTILGGDTIPYTTFTKGALVIGVIGIGIELMGLVDPRNYGDTKYLDPVVEAEKQARFLKKEKQCDFVICLSHLGYQYKNQKIDDLKLAAQTTHLDLILGGHTHTFMNKVEFITNLAGRKVGVHQAGWAGIDLGRIDLCLQKDSGLESLTSSAIQLGPRYDQNRC